LKARTLALSSLFLVVLIACLKTPVTVNAVTPTPPPPAPPPATLLWWDPTAGANDIALSKDGRYVAVVGFVPSPSPHQELRFYGRSSGTPLWTYSQYGFIIFGSVAISADGDCVAIGTTYQGGDVRFWRNAKSRNPSIPSDTDPTWTSVNLGGPIYKRCLDISDDGNYVVACGTGQFVFYWADAKSEAKSGSGVSWSWRSPDLGTAHAVDLSSDGDYVATGGDWYVAYWKDARTPKGGPQAFDWKSTKPTDSILDVAISDDGNYVAAAGRGFPSPVYYWADAKFLSDDPTTTWESAAGVDFSSIDMSSDGDEVIAGAIGPNPEDQGVYFWSGARGRVDTQPWSWRYTTLGPVHDVAINDAGDYMAAANDEAVPSVYFFDSAGDPLWVYQPLDDEASGLVMSWDGGTLAVGTGEVDSAYLFNTGYPMKPVGGVAVPTDRLALLSPWIGIAFAALAVGVFATRRRRKA